MPSMKLAEEIRRRKETGSYPRQEQFSPEKLDLGCGQNKREGFTGIDFVEGEGIDIVHDLFTFPWPIKDDCVSEVWCSHFFEHIPGMLRGKWMNELYRVMKPEAKATIIVPHGNSNRAAQDFTHAWPPVVPSSFYYFNKGWREANKLTHGHYALTCDFDFGWSDAVTPDWFMRAEEARAFAIRHYHNVADDLQVFLTKRAPS